MVGIAWSKVSFMLPSSECTNNGKGHINIKTDRIHKQGLLSGAEIDGFVFFSFSEYSQVINTSLNKGLLGTPVQFLINAII